MESHRPPIEVLIVGAGPTGLALACHGLRLGLRVRIIDKQSQRSTTSKAIGLQFRVSEILACMGVMDRFAARGNLPVAVNMYAGRRRLVRLDFRKFQQEHGRDAFAPRVIMIPQSETEAILGELLFERGGQVEWNTEFLGFQQDEEKVVSRLRHASGREELVTSQWLVSCEGAHSVARKLAGLAFTGKTYPMAFFMADVELDWPRDHAEGHVWFHKDGSVGALPLPSPRTWRLIVEVTRQIDRLQEIALDTIRELLQERCGDDAARISNPTWISEFRINCRMVDHYKSGRVLLAGDAAHIHSPTGGQGIVTGIQDATNLAWKLARVVRGAPQELLDTYEEERLPKAREVLQETDRTTRVFFAPTRPLRLLRDFVVLPVLRRDWVQRKLFAKMAQLHVNYRESSLSRHADARPWFFSSRIRAGDRAPDVAFRRALSGKQTTLFELLQPLRPVALIGVGPPATDGNRVKRLMDALNQLEIDAYLIVPSESAPKQPDPRCLFDVHGDFGRMYGMRGEFLCLIRPDDHVGLFQRPIDEAGLRVYLQKLCPPEAVLAAIR